MNSINNSTDPPGGDSLAFYVFDNLRCSQDRAGGNVYRFDSLDDAVACYERMPKEWTTALGGSRSDLSELDLVQRRMGVDVLVTDFGNFPEWKADAQVQQAVGALVDRLGIGLMTDRSIVHGPVLVPLEERDPAGDRYLSDKRLRLSDAAWPASAINEAFVSGDGWLSLDELVKLSRDFGYNDPRCPVVTQLNVAYEADDGRIGQMDIAPREFGFLAERTPGRDLTPQNRGYFPDPSIVNSLMGQVFQWKEAAADLAAISAPEREETFEQLARKAKERAYEKNLDRPEKPAAYLRDMEL